MKGAFAIHVAKLVRGEAFGVRIDVDVGVGVGGKIKIRRDRVDSRMSRDDRHAGLLSRVLCVLRVKGAGKLSVMDRRGGSKNEEGVGEGGVRAGDGECVVAG